MSERGVKEKFNARFKELMEKIDKISKVLVRVVDKLDLIETSFRELKLGGSGPAVESKSLSGGGAGRANENDDVVLNPDYINDTLTIKGEKDFSDCTKLSKKSNEEVVNICCKSIRYEIRRTDFLTLILKRVDTDWFKSGYFNFIQQYNSYQNYFWDPGGISMKSF